MQGAAQSREAVRKRHAEVMKQAERREAAAPFATTAQQGSKSALVSADVESRLLRLNLEHDSIRDQLARLGAGAGRTREARAKKMELEREMAENEREKAAAKLWLRKYGVE